MNGQNDSAGRNQDGIQDQGRPETWLILPNLVKKRAAETPDAVFLQEVGGRRLTYAQTYEEVCRWAAALLERGVQPGDRVASMFPTSIDAVHAWCGAAMIGAINVPLNTSYMGQMLQHAIDLVDPRVVLCGRQFIGVFADIDGRSARTLLAPMDEAEGRNVFGGQWRFEDLDHALSSADGTSVREPRHDWADVATLMFTSGTTGPSKAVVMPWLHFYETCWSIWQGEFASDTDCMYDPWPINHVTGAGSVYLMAMVGGCCVLREKWSTSSFMDDIYTYQCTITTLMLEMTRFVAEMELPEGRGECPLERIFLVPTKPDVEPLMAKVGARYCTDYNMTELNGPIVSVGFDPVPVGAAGKQRAGVELRIVDENEVDVAAGQVGELLVRTRDKAAMNQGYWGMPEATQKAWRNGWFHTGDLLRRDADGYFYFIERMGDRIRHRGENVSAFELEQIVNEHPQIRQSAAVAVPGAAGEDDIALYVLASPELTREDIAAYCQEYVPKFMRPHHIVFVDKFPRTPTGKVMKKFLSQDLAVR